MKNEFNQFNSSSKNIPPELREKKGLIDQKVIKSFGNFLAQAALSFEKQKSEKDIAKEVGVNDTSVTNWEEGISFPRDEILDKVATAYGVSLDELKEKMQISKDAQKILTNARKQKAGVSVNPLDPIPKNGMNGRRSEMP